MKKTVLITGSSSGIGKATVIHFAKQGWAVAATMRQPGKEKDFAAYPNVRLFALDVNDTDRITAVMSQVHQDLGRLDVVVNNAGYGLEGVFEAMDDDVIRRQFDTNVFGLMRVTRAAVKLMREQGRGGTIIQLSSMGGRLAFPLYSIYHASKWAVEGFTESLQYELHPLGIRLKLIEPGIIKTEFTGRSRELVKPKHTPVYNDLLDKFEKAVEATMPGAASPEVVARMIFKAATDNGKKLRYPVGKPAPALLRLRPFMSDSFFASIIKNTYKI